MIACFEVHKVHPEQFYLQMLSLRANFGFFYITVFLTKIVVDLAIANAASNSTDRLALLDFKSKINQDPQSVFSSWNDSVHFCQWQGVRCSNRDERVTILKLDSKGFVGSLSPSLGNLSFLQGINLSNNTFQGKIPEELGRLFQLRNLALNNNSFTGLIPANLSQSSRLEYLGLYGNNLEGNIPEEFVSVTNLQYLLIHKNKLSGSFPPFIGNLTSLVSISAADNFFQGTIPDIFYKLKNLDSLGIGTNYFSGRIPASIYNLSSLSVLSLSENELNGSLPRDIGLSLPNVQLLQLRNNQLSGPVPLSIANASKLISLEIGNNKFTGKLSVNFGGLKYLRVMSLSFNGLGTGEADEFKFMESLINCTRFYALDLVANRFEGILPNSLANLSSGVGFIGVSRNRISGTVPPGIGNLVNLNTLGLELNGFTGPIPDEIGKLQKLQMVSMSYNKLSGEIPPSIGNLTLLLELDLQNNELQGKIPNAIGNCQNLLQLNLNRNNLSGSVPNELFSIMSLSSLLDISRNNFSGPLPPEVGNLRSLVQLDISENGFLSDIPSTLSSCMSLEYLYMQYNFFEGPIPPSLSSLRGLRKLDLSHNYLSGEIPEYLKSFSLQMLNLSFNDLEGEVPLEGGFLNGSIVSLEGNKKLCGGIPELHLLNCKSKKHKLRLLYILLIALACGIVAVIAHFFVLFSLMKRRRERHPPDLLSAETLPKVSYSMLRRATNEFSSANLIGSGSFGSVYKGVLNQEVGLVAIKVLNLQNRRASKSFETECEALRNIRHKNLVKIITSCSSVDFQGNDFKALVYEFMPNGSLEMRLHSNALQGQSSGHLNLFQIINIAIDVAYALEYLHHHSHTPIIHCDLKPSNILLDDDMTAHVGDFGLAKFYPEVLSSNHSSSAAIRGTIGYAAPEYGLGSEVSMYGDIYGYGITLLEMITGKRPTDSIFQNGLNLHNFAKTAHAKQDPDVIDQTIFSGIEESSDMIHVLEESAMTLIKIGVSCSAESPQDRMSIRNVISGLENTI